MIEVRAFVAEPGATKFGVGLQPVDTRMLEASALELRGHGFVAEPIDSADHVLLLEGGRPIGRLDCWAGEGKRFGFTGLLPTIGLPLDFDVEMRLIGQAGDGSRAAARLGSLRGSRRWVRSDYEPRYRPVLVTSFGRSGSTLLMSLLADVPEVAIPRIYPFEVREAAYFARQFAVVSSPANHAWGSTPEDIASSTHQFQVGSDPHVHHRPWRELFDDQMRTHLTARRPASAKSTALRMIDEFYGALTPESGGGGPFFAEKVTPGVLLRLFDELYDGEPRCLFLVRDFRDMICSIQSFNQERGRRDWGETDDVEHWMRALQSAIGQLVSAHRERPTALTVMYENLVEDEQAVVERARDWLGGPRAPGDDTPQSSMLELPARHRTSGPGKSVGRWKTDLSPDLRDAAHEYLGEYLEYFGYELQ